MPIINSILNWVATKREYQIDFFRKYPVEVQEETLDRIVQKSKDTLIGRDHGFRDISSYRQFQQQIPVRDYDAIKPYIQKVLDGEPDVLYPGEVKWFAKSSGTTGDKSKFIPVNREFMEDCHFRGGKDTVILYHNNNPQSSLLKGKGLVIGGSHQISSFNADSYFGDLSAVLLQNMPGWAHFFRTPDLSIALMDEWEEKIEKMAEVTIQQNVTNISGVPSWTLVLLNRILEITGTTNIREVWPKLEVFMHGGVSFKPYREQFKNIIAGPMNYVETFNASEGFFGIQDDPDKNDMLLMLDYSVFYEFIPIEQMDNDDPIVYPLSDVEVGKNYAMVISTSGGLWRYLIGDTVRFTSTFPFKIIITGRTRHFMNAFGEEIIVDNAEVALRKACKNSLAEITEYTAAPVYMEGTKAGRHQWLIEFSKAPENLGFFEELLDNALKATNSDYEAKRYKSIALHQPEVISLPRGTFYRWMKEKGKLGGQHKVPRLSNERSFVNEILEIIQKS
ncbi:MAG: GH3 auxin-responsive promoter family protein [Bacteroidetes bacterium]|jgi:hypothetical protein|nr:GH3 auxin-responsive promoter family protein [Bacteroidota bacterium]MBT4401332.1 GH3 auxin-responsive promoter family protein [Bacteroidota bacterium]MBT4408982.1 GH3 auxin-responsive promoter family protein [Bacteroidota bacterium]MBT5425223.1 GH3 auxin-responsive promoter family protein [Bacteroidota bacterium]MBT7465468.1 GH3 auxin-responsive promoter family protein [Bacteroidota bacterium]